MARVVVHPDRASSEDVPRLDKRRCDAVFTFRSQLKGTHCHQVLESIAIGAITSRR